MDDDLVRYDVARGAATITLDSPHNRNALSTGLMAQLRERLTAAQADRGVRVVVLTGSGSVFCSGADLKEQRQRNEAGTTQTGGGFAALPEILTLMWEARIPVVGRINGAARAGGVGLVSACDIALAPTPATFAFSEVRLGLVPAVISVTSLARLTPRAGLEYLLTGETFDAARAVEIGLLNRAVDASALDAEVERYCDMLRRGGPEALERTKQVVREVPGTPMRQAFEQMLALSLDRFASAEAREGMRSFAEKRDPAWVDSG
jgi:methylglutaconyl-CoA hydratase